MAVVSVTANNTRVEDAESATGWLNIGGGLGGAAEASFPYQGQNLFNRKVTSSTGAGFYYDPNADGGAPHDMTSVAKSTMLFKFIVTDYGGLQPTNGVRLRLGSSDTAYYVFITAGSSSPLTVTDKYPDKGGIVIIPVNPNVAGYRAGTGVGTPTLSAVDYFGFVAAFATSTAKSENFGVDAIDLGTGLTLVGGDGVDTDGSFQNFLAFDEGTINNRFGYVTQSNTVLNCYGTLTIGTTTATGFSDSSSRMLFLDGMFNSGWSGVRVNLQNASTVVNISNNIASLGTDSVVDTRADFIVNGTSGTLNLGAELENFRNITLTSSVAVNGASIEAKDLTQGGATISDSEFFTNTTSGVAFINDITFSAVSNCTFTQIGTGHAIEITTPGTYTMLSLFYNGYGGTAGSNLTPSSGANDAVIYNNSGGAVTLNISGGGDTPSIRNGAGATTSVNNSVTVKLTAVDALTGNPVVGARVLMEADTGGDLSVGTDILTGLTDSNGVVQNTGFSYTNPQPVKGRVRKGTSSPLYVTAPIVGTITASGLDITVTMISDE